MMGLPPSTQERAYQLARDGTVRDINALHLRLKREGYDPTRLRPEALVGLRHMFDRALSQPGDPDGPSLSG